MARGWSELEIARVFELDTQGLSGYEIARSLRRPRSSVAQILRDGRAAHEHGRAA